MRYKIEINLKALHELGSEISLEEAVLLDYLYWLCSSPSEDIEQMRIEKDGKKYTWFNYGFYIKETPILRVKSKSVITPKLKALEEEGFIETFLEDGYRKYIRLLPKIDTLFRNMNATVPGTKRLPFGKKNIYNNTNNNKTKIMKREQTPSEEMRLFLEGKEFALRLAKMISEKSGIPIDKVVAELNNFKGYWTELNKSGKKQRWEDEKHFQLSRRLSTWFRNADKFASSKASGRKISIAF